MNFPPRIECAWLSAQETMKQEFDSLEEATRFLFDSRNGVPDRINVSFGQNHRVRVEQWIALLSKMQRTGKIRFSVAPVETG